MPGPVSDSFNPEFGPGENAGRVYEAVKAAYVAITKILGDQPPEPIVEVVLGGRRGEIEATLDERTWRCLRFACGRALESL